MMILNVEFIGIACAFALLGSAHGSPYSNVYFQKDYSDPVTYFSYGAPAVYSNAQIARISAPPIGSVVPVSKIVPPCVSPCVITNQKIAPVAPLLNKAKIVAYNAPSVPDVVPPVEAQNNDSGYEYSYVVYDENTGDQKAQYETSDGSVVRGEYSFIQPDGYVREVKYTADDLTGFNVIVKRILPNSITGGAAKTETKEAPKPGPCDDNKKEALVVEPEPPVENYVTEDSHIFEIVSVSGEPTTVSETPVIPEIIIKEITVPETTTGLVTPEPTYTTQLDQTTEGVTHTETETQTEIKLEVIPVTDHETLETHAAQESQTNSIISYEDIIRCVQSKLARYGPLNNNISPLTYIILPTGKLC